MEVIHPKRAIDYSYSSSNVSGEKRKRKRKTTTDEFVVDDARIEDLFPPSSEYNRSLCIRTAKLRVTQFQLYFKSIGQIDLAMRIQSPQDIDDNVSEEELQKFKKKGWNLCLREEVDDGDSFDYYQCLILDSKLYHEYICVCSTYEIDKEYSKVYREISNKIEVGMELGRVQEVAEKACKKFPGLHISVAFAAIDDCLRSKDLENWREERVDLNFHLWDDVFINKRRFWDVLRDIYDEELHLYPNHEDLLIHDFDYNAYRPSGQYSIQMQFEKFCQFVQASTGLSCDKVDGMTLEVLAKKFAEKECVIRATYAEYIEEKILLAKKLGILQCEGAN